MSKPIDSTKPLRLAVLREDTIRAQGHAGDDTSCAVAQSALRRRGIVAASIGATVALIRFTDGRTLRYRVAPETQAIIRAFDDSDIFPTVTAVLLPPKVKLGDRVGTKPGTNKRSGKAKTIARHLERAASRHVHPPR